MHIILNFLLGTGLCPHPNISNCTVPICVAITITDTQTNPGLRMRRVGNRCRQNAVHVEIYSRAINARCYMGPLTNIDYPSNCCRIELKLAISINPEIRPVITKFQDGIMTPAVVCTIVFNPSF